MINNFLLKKTTITFILLLLSFSIKADYKTERLNIYLTSLQLIGNKKELSEELTKAINMSSDITELFMLAKFAEDSSLTDEAKNAYRQILVFAPDNAKAMIRLASLLYTTNRQSEAKFYLIKYNLLTGGDYISNYELGILYSLNGNKDIAEQLLTEALNEINKIPKKDLHVKLIQADILSNLGKYEKADKIYSKLLKEYPADSNLKLDYVDMLIKWGQFDEASNLLSTFPKLKDKPNSSRLMLGTKSLGQNYSRIQLRVNVYRASIFLLQEELGKAFKLIKKMRIHFPNDYETLVSEADAYTVQGNWRKEKGLIEKAIELQPGNRDLLKRINEINRVHTSKMSLENYNKFSYGTSNGNAIEFILKESIDLKITDLLSIGAVNRQDFINTKNVSFLNGNTGSYNGLKQETEIYTQFDFEGNNFFNGSTLRLSYFLADNYNILQNSGLGLSYKYLDNYGNTSFELYFRKPYNDLPVAVVNGANRNRIMLGRQLRIIPELDIYADIAFNNYGARDQFNLDNALEYHLNLAYTFPSFEIQKEYLGVSSQLGINYFLDSEIFFTSKEATNSAGNKYRILPLDSRLVNTIALFYYNEFTPNFRLNLMAGYAFNVLGTISHGPVASINLTYVINKYLEANLNASHYIGTTTSTYIGCGITLNYIELLKRIWKEI